MPFLMDIRQDLLQLFYVENNVAMNVPSYIFSLDPFNIKIQAIRHHLLA